MIDSSNDLIKLGAASRQDQGCEGNDLDHVELVANYVFDLGGGGGGGAGSKTKKKNDNDKDASPGTTTVELTAAVAELLPSLNNMMEKEIELLSMLTDGSAIMDHMEDLYFYALQRVIIKEITDARADKIS
uniref:Uncharacterized protein n=1 Tax=Lotharella oceanica TaxID=641309 RepID=A0A7S2XED3_9EUKA|mmetsp:Transcript_35061/g.64947  ORF Transcript_35061/g.64947 Transcript_35061/m.64947 type:complete len:131 (+) Transcript_35061:106-498(+)|eukprot:CAMPEP_0170190980 /NCGR_PEP_ID=MMETSP0040_2-20121228/50597_1 /TAXON_ID=641309 /ORGANISM="Lotharella oceanica, Strain CCMP622" /LENGTH=130 /DNA_ID=CAMNT_0010438955 /DNA_START=91 /DNA_END=483 /DNA_ORIENTATION=-